MNVKPLLESILTHYDGTKGHSGLQVSNFESLNSEISFHADWLPQLSCQTDDWIVISWLWGLQLCDTTFQLCPLQQTQSFLLEAIRERIDLVVCFFLSPVDCFTVISSAAAFIVGIMTLTTNKVRTQL